MEETVGKREEKKSAVEWLKEHPKSVFWSRLISWATFCCFLPFVFIVWRFQLFHKVERIQIGGWGIIGIVIVAVFVYTVIRYVRLAFSARYSFIVQILNGVCKVIIPLLAVLIIIYNVRNNINLMLQVLGCIVICEAIAIPLNPLPQWAYECQKNVRVEERKEAFDYLVDTLFNKKAEVEKGEK